MFLARAEYCLHKLQQMTNHNTDKTPVPCTQSMLIVLCNNILREWKVFAKDYGLGYAMTAQWVEYYMDM